MLTATCRIQMQAAVFSETDIPSNDRTNLRQTAEQNPVK